MTAPYQPPPKSRMREGSTTDDYRNALSGEGEFMSLGYDWSDKPHRLVYDLCGEVDHLRQALRIIAGLEQCADNLMGNADVARAALER